MIAIGLVESFWVVFTCNEDTSWLSRLLVLLVEVPLVDEVLLELLLEALSLLLDPP